MAKTINGTLKHKVATPTQWETKNPVLKDRELGIERDGNNINLRLGDGQTAWNDLPNLKINTAQGIITLGTTPSTVEGAIWIVDS